MDTKFSIPVIELAIYVLPEGASSQRQDDVCQWLQTRGGKPVSTTSYVFITIKAPDSQEFEDKFAPVLPDEGYVLFKSSNNNLVMEVSGGTPSQRHDEILIKKPITSKA